MYLYALRSALLFGLTAALSCGLPASLQAQTPQHTIYHHGWMDLDKNGREDVYENPHMPIDRRVADLLSRMTLNEKTCQLVTLYGYGAVLKDSLPTPAWKQAVWKDGIANIDEQLTGLRASTTYAYPYSAHARALNQIQRFFIEDTRLGIPADFTTEGIRGLNHMKATYFPCELGQASSFDTALVSALAHQEGREAHALGYTNVYAPVLGVATDPRWGRTVETYGSDPYLNGQMGKQMVEGLQSEGVISTCKHFAVYSIPIGGRDGSVRTHPRVAPREMRELYLEPFRVAFQDAHAHGVMASYNEYDGVPIIASRQFLTDFLRKQFGFKGYVVSDSHAVEMLYDKHHVATDYEDAIRQCLEAGLNVRTDFTPPEKYLAPLRDAVKTGKIPMKVINERVAEVLWTKFAFGLFDHPYVKDPAAADTLVNNARAQALALKAAEEGIVLLKNTAGLLPLKPAALHRVAVIGPNAAAERSLESRYGPTHAAVTTVLAGLQQALEPRGVEVSYVKGCSVTDPHYPQSDIQAFPLDAAEKAGIDSAVALARASDAAVVVLGDGLRTIGESHSRVSLELPGHQEALLEAVAATGKPVILVLVNGRPLSINWAQEHVGAILETWYLGQATGTAIAQVLTGAYDPGGRLSIPFPKTVGQVPLSFPMKPGDEGGSSARVSGFLYPFGFGLSYTTFAYSGLQLSTHKVAQGKNIEVSFQVRNTGSVAGDVVPQLYIHDEVSSVTTYVEKLRGFARVHLAPGASQELHFWITPRDLSLYDRQMKFSEEPGWFDVWVGNDSEDIRLKDRFKVTGPPVQD